MTGSGGKPRSDRLIHKLRMISAKSRDHLFVLFRFGRAGTIDEHPAGPQEPTDVAEDPELPSLMIKEVIFTLGPFRFRMPSEDTQPATRRIDQNSIERSPDGLAQRRIITWGAEKILRIGTVGPDHAHTKPFQILLQQLQP